MHGSGLVDVVFVRITTWGISTCRLTQGSGSADVVRPKESRSEDVEIYGKGADDHIGLRLSIGLGVSK